MSVTTAGTVHFELWRSKDDDKFLKGYYFLEYEETSQLQKRDLK